jgi:PAS domain S-box-containing protein
MSSRKKSTTSSQKATPSSDRPAISASTSLRQKAEEKSQAAQMQIGRMSPEEIRNLVHDLQVHQVELEMQNEALRETQLALEEARDRFAALFDSSPVGYIALNPKDRMLEVNLRFCQLVGGKRKDLLHQSFLRFLDSGEQPKFRRHLDSLASSEGPRTSETLTLRGGDIPHRVRLESCVETMPALSQEPLYRIAVVDVTEEESALSVNAGILQSTKEGIYGLDRRGCVTFFNRTGEDLTGWKASELLGRPAHHYLHHTKPDGSPYAEKEWPVLQTLHHGESISIETEFLWRKDGTGFPAEYASTPLLNESEEVEGAVVTFRDITARKRSEEQLRNSRDLLTRQQEELHALTARLYKIQEEERERISRELHDDISQRLALLQIKFQMSLPSQACEKNQEILEDIRGLSDDVRKIVYRYHPYTLQDLGLESSMRSLVADFVKWQHLPITLSTHNVPRHLPPEVTTCVYRVAQESFHNIAKHAQAASIQCELEWEPGGLRLVIQDDGIGFTKTDSSLRGLGLVNMQERAHHLHGRLTIDSDQGEGTRIHFWIPLGGEGTSKNSP